MTFAGGDNQMVREEILVTIRLNTEGIALPPRIPLSPL
jgi:hypothetical protein